MKKWELVELNMLLQDVAKHLILLDTLAFDRSEAEGASLLNVTKHIEILQSILETTVEYLDKVYNVKLPKIRDYR